MKDLNFILASNLQLDKPFTNIVVNDENLKIMELLATTPKIAFENLIKTCLQKKIIFLVISGTTFIHTPVGSKIKTLFLDGLRTLIEANISIFISESISDPLLLNELSSISDKIIYYKNDQIAVTPIIKDKEKIGAIFGTGADSQIQIEELNDFIQTSSDGDAFKMGILPLTICEETSQNYILENISSLNLDAIFLSHSARRNVSSKNQFFPFSRGLSPHSPLDEGDYGCLLVTFNPKKPHEFEEMPINLSPIGIQDIYIDISDIHDIAQFEKCLSQMIQELARKNTSTNFLAIIANIHINGIGKINDWLQSEAAEKHFKNLQIYYEHFKPAAILLNFIITTETNTENMQNGDLLQELASLSHEIMNNEEDLNHFIDTALSPLLSNPELASLINKLTSPNKLQLLKNARAICGKALEQA